jgi:DNA-binding MarR family transcriptional regulator
MDHDVALEQAKTLAALLPTLMRQLMAGHDDPAAELPLAQLRVCSLLCGEPVPMSALGRELGVSSSAMTQIADRLERARLVKRVAQGDDRRIRCLALTERGAKIMRLHQETRVERVLAVLEHVPPREREEALASLQNLIRACDVAREGDGNSKEHDPHFSTSKVLL